MSGWTDTIQVAGIAKESIVDGPGLRFVVFAQGCPFRCAGCHNEEARAFEGGQKRAVDDLVAEVGKNPLLDGATFSGGEPFAQPKGFSRLAGKLKEAYPERNVVVYTGYTYEELSDPRRDNPDVKALLAAADYLIDGRFERGRRDLKLAFKGSANQRFIDLNATRRVGRLVTVDF